MAKKLWLVGAVAALLVFPGIGFSAVVLDLSLTDTSSGADHGEGTVYNLLINDTLTAGEYTGTLTANTINNPDWYIGFWSLKLDATEWSGTGPTGDWSFVMGPNAVDLVGANNWPQNQRDGSYVGGVVDDASVNVTQGAQLITGGSYVWSFAFTSAGVNFDDLPFQVGYFSPNSPATPRLSQSFGGGGGTQVPEPSSLILLGAGLIGLAGFGMKKFKK